MKKHTNGYWLNEHEFMSWDGQKKPLGIKATRAASLEGRAFSAIMGALPNPDEILRKSGKGVEAYRELMYDAQVSSCIDSRKAGVMALEWDFNRGEIDTDVSKFVKDCFKDIPMYQIFSQILDAPVFGYSVLECYYIPKDGYYPLVAVKGKPSEWFCFGQENELLFRSTVCPNGEHTDSRKFVVATNKATETNPYGEAILSRCFWPVTFKKNGLKYWLKFAEKYGMPYLYGKLPMTSAGDTEKQDEFLTILEDIVQDGVGVYEEGTEITLLEANRGSSVDTYKGIVQYFDSQISKAILSHSSGVDSTPGSLGNENQSIVVREDIVQADKRIIETAINDIIKKLVRLNFGDNAPLPVFAMFEQEDVNKDRADRDAVLKGMGVNLKKPYFKKWYNLQDDEFDIVEAAPAASPYPSFAEPNHFADGADGARTAQAILDLGNKGIAASERTQKAVDNVLNPIIEIINAGSSFSDVKAKILNSFEDKKVEDLQEVFGDAMFVSDVVGRLEARTKTNAKP